ncbi:transaldolase [Lichenibacterium minor]|nr:transaldolase [Lichenibacterium minor]
MNPLQQLEACGQSPWLDDLHRTLMSSGELKNLIDNHGLKGLTSNPSIFEKAIGSTNDYDDVLKEMLGKGDADDMTVYETIAIADIQAAADVFLPVYEGADGGDGFVSLEVAPNIANDTEATKKDAKRLWAAVDRPNLMIKIPGTDAGTPAIQATIAEGINVNVTLLFAVKAYEDVAQAYIAGLEELAAKGGDVSRVASVASFFLSRIDSAADAKIDALEGADPALVEMTRHKIAIANAKRAYQRGKQIFSGPRWEALAAKGAHPQRLLWASTGTKSKSLPDTYYVDNIIGLGTVNTMPPATMKAFGDHGTAIKDSIESDVAGAEASLAALEKLGISLDEITHELVIDGIKKFEEAFDNLIGGVKKRRGEFSKAA